MPFRFASPEDLVQLEMALERAWAMLQDRRGQDPLGAAAERERLAYVVAMVWRQGPDDRIAEKAIEHFKVTAPAHTPNDASSV